MNSLTDNIHMNDKKFNIFNGGASSNTNNNSSLKNNYNQDQDDNENQDDEDGDDDDLEEGQSSSQNTADMIAAKQSLMSINALLNYNKIMNGDTSLQTSQTAAATAAAAALMSAEASSSSAALIGGSSFGSACNMQPFLFECNDEAYSANFVPCMVYLPVKTKLTANSITIKVTLKPLDQQTDATSAATNGNNNNSGSIGHGSEIGEYDEENEEGEYGEREAECNDEVDENSQS